VVSGPSGVGKSTLIHGLISAVPNIGFSVSATTRKPRVGERDGVDYYFRSDDEFRLLISEGEFLEHAQVYDRRYGTLRAPTEEVLATGRSVLLDIDVQGARQVREAVPDSIHIMILPPSVRVLEERLLARAKDSTEVISERMRQVASQLGGRAEYDYLVVNDDLGTAQRVFNSIIRAELSRRSRNQGLVDAIGLELAHLK
jgi:guanylate kinase